MDPTITVPAEIPRMVLDQLRYDAGLTVTAICRRSGVDRATIQRLTTGRNVAVKTADRLYALQAEVEMERPDLAKKWALDDGAAAR